MDTSSFTESIAFQAVLDPNKPAVIYQSQIVTYGQLEQGVRCSIAQLRKLGLQNGSIVGVRVEHPIRHLALTLAAARLGMASVPRFVNDNGSPKPQPTVVLSETPLAQASGLVSVIVNDGWFRSEAPVTDFSEATSKRSGIFRISASSGSTGTPGLSAVTFEAFEEHVRQQVFVIDTVGALTRLHCSLNVGGAWAIMHSLAMLTIGKTLSYSSSAEESRRTIVAFGCEYLLCSVNQLVELVQLQRENFVPLPSLRAITVGGSLIPSTLIRDAQALLAQRIMRQYGTTELGCVAFQVAREGQLDNAAGFICPWIEAEAVDEARSPLPAGQQGELRMRSPAQASILDAETGKMEATAAPPWLYPGDLGAIEPNGQLSITGRVSNVINIGGVKISPDVIEAVLLQHPKVEDAAVLSRSGRDGLEEIWALVVAERDFDLADLKVFFEHRGGRAHLGHLTRVDAIPRGADGKILRQDLKRLVAG